MMNTTKASWLHPTCILKRFCFLLAFCFRVSHHQTELLTDRGQEQGVLQPEGGNRLGSLARGSPKFKDMSQGKYPPTLTHAQPAPRSKLP